MSSIAAALKRHPLLSYYALVFAISWGGILLAMGPRGIPANGEEAGQMLVGPSVAGILLTGLIDGRDGLRDLAARLLRWRVGARWYALALLTAPLLIAAIFLVLSLFTPDFLPRLFTDDDQGFLLQFSIVAGLLVGCFEELGWTGFVLPKLRRHTSVLIAGLSIGFVYAAWNFLVVFWVSTATGTAGSLPIVLFMPAVLFTWLPTYRVLMVLVYDRTGSLLVAMLMHASLIAFWRIFTPLTLTGAALITCYLLLTAALWLVIAVIWRLPPGSRSARVAAPVGIPYPK